ncbi:hypothetical protein DMC18_18105 [Caulobacter sp. D5]|uniref:hypothetical protein n=1 Tax=Caulobacter sp. D5 TaxID=357400 RepID=UPI000D72B4CC|nr:hypothetical protein [Caulobacter sp. D5]PXA88995.1 hypothetical protein DMC18_18105 [Caulobacter sp. D5]
MADDGYTLAEALAAMTVLGLAIGGLGLAVTAISVQQRPAEVAHDDLARGAAVDLALDRLLDGQGPFGGDADLAFSGSPQSLSFACGGGVCGARIDEARRGAVVTISGRDGVSARWPLKTQSARFAYVDDRGARRSDWTGSGSRLRAVAIEQGGEGRLIALARLDVDENRGCLFDAVVGECRETAP